MSAGSPEIAPPRLDHAFTLLVDVTRPQERGIVDGAQRRFVAITGGQVIGPQLTGTVLAGGGDWQAIHPDGLTEVSTRYAIQAADGGVIEVANAGVRVASSEVTQRLARDEPVDPSDYYFRTQPRFVPPAGRHEWLRRTVFVGVGIRRPTSVEIRVFAVR